MYTLPARHSPRQSAPALQSTVLCQHQNGSRCRGRRRAPRRQPAGPVRRAGRAPAGGGGHRPPARTREELQGGFGDRGGLPGPVAAAVGPGGGRVVWGAPPARHRRRALPHAPGPAGQALRHGGLPCSHW